MSKLLLLALIFQAQSVFANVPSWKKLIETEGAKSWIASSDEKIQLTHNEIEVADAKPSSQQQAKSYIEVQEFYRSWTNRLMGISKFSIREFKWDPVTNKLTFSGDYLNGDEKYIFRETHEFKEKIFAKQMVWPSSVDLNAKGADELWKLEP